MEKLGLLAGVGHLPAACARAARALGYEVHVIALLPDCDPELKDAASVYREISIGSIGAILAYLKGKDALADQDTNENKPVSTETKQGSYLR